MTLASKYKIDKLGSWSFVEMSTPNILPYVSKFESQQYLSK